MTQKLLTLVVPAYNVEKYLVRCLDSLLGFEEDTDILVINDGSTDQTEQIALDYAQRYPQYIQVITKPNGGHGSAINKGLELAQGEYFYVVDADDWLDRDALSKLLHAMRKARNNDSKVDLFIVNYVYEKINTEKRHVVHYRYAIPRNRPFTWDETNHFGFGRFILLHSTVQKTSVLRECGIVLPEHTFYVDNIMVYNPLPHFHKMYYLDVDLYRYFIGRNDQSVNHHSMIERIDQYVRVAKIMIDGHHLGDITNKKLRRYMYNYLSIVLAIVNAFLTLSKKPENDEKKAKLRNYLREHDRTMYRKISRRFLYIASSTNTKLGRFVLRNGYRIGRLIFKYN
jgi:glycosyltransferase involved in cell wall biosynthesis